MGLSSMQEKSAHAATPGGAAPWPNPGYAWYTVSVFALALMINFFDRGIVTLLVEPIKKDLQLSDVEVSMLMGLAYIGFYVVLGLPIARLADLRNRKWIVTAGITAYSVFTALCGFSKGFWHLFLCRVGIGAGEACNGPATFSMLADLFPPEKLPRAIAVMNFGFMAGNGLALLGGGLLVGYLAVHTPITVPLLGVMKDWQLTFILAAIPGLLVALVMAVTLREPVRRLPVHASGRDTPSLGEVFRFLLLEWRTYLPMFASLALFSIAAFGAQMWGPSFWIRTHGWTPAQIGVVIGVIALVVSPFGAMTGAKLAEYFFRKGYTDANVRVVVISHLLTIPLGIAFPLMPSAELAVAVLVVSSFIGTWVIGPQNAALQVVTPGRMRAQVTALFLFVFNVIGFGLGPTVIASVAELGFSHTENPIRWGLLACTAVLGPLGTWVLWRGMKPYGALVARTLK